MELYIVNRIKKTTIRNYIDSYNRCIKYIGYMKLADIQITHVQNMVIELANKGYKKSTIRSTVSVVSSCLETGQNSRTEFETHDKRRNHKVF